MNQLNSLQLELSRLKQELTTDLSTATTRNQHIRLVQHISHLDRILDTIPQPE